MKHINKTILALFLSLMLVLLAACALTPPAAEGSSDVSALPQFDENTASFPTAGYSLQFPDVFANYASEGVFSYSEAQSGCEADGTAYYHKLYADFMPFESLDIINDMEQNADELTEMQKDAYIKEIYASLKNLFVITVYDKKTLNAALAGGKDISEVTGCANNRLIGEQEGLVYYFSTPDRNLSGLKEDSKQAYEALYDTIPDVVEGITFFPPDRPGDEGAADVGS